MNPTLSIVIPVTRYSINRALESIRQQDLMQGDEVILILDGYYYGGIDTLSLPCKIFCREEAARDWGHTPRNLGFSIAKANYIASIDDDDVYLPYAFNLIRSSLLGCPHAPHLFKIINGEHGPFWVDPVLRLSNVSTQMVVVPNVPGKLGRWGHRYVGDYDFISETVELYNGSVVWCENIIVHHNKPCSSWFRCETYGT